VRVKGIHRWPELPSRVGGDVTNDPQRIDTFSWKGRGDPNCDGRVDVFDIDPFLPRCSIRWHTTLRTPAATARFGIEPFLAALPP
jgi:hypothetical protein